MSLTRLLAVVALTLIGAAAASAAEDPPQTWVVHVHCESSGCAQFFGRDADLDKAVFESESACDTWLRLDYDAGRGIQRSGIPLSHWASSYSTRNSSKCVPAGSSSSPSIMESLIQAAIASNPDLAPTLLLGSAGLGLLKSWNDSDHKKAEEKAALERRLEEERREAARREAQRLEDLKNRLLGEMKGIGQPQLQAKTSSSSDLAVKVGAGSDLKMKLGDLPFGTREVRGALGSREIKPIAITPDAPAIHQTANLSALQQLTCAKGIMGTVSRDSSPAAGMFLSGEAINYMTGSRSRVACPESASLGDAPVPAAVAITETETKEYLLEVAFYNRQQQILAQRTKLLIERESVALLRSIVRKEREEKQKAVEVLQPKPAAVVPRPPAVSVVPETPKPEPKPEPAEDPELAKARRALAEARQREATTDDVLKGQDAKLQADLDNVSKESAAFEKSTKEWSQLVKDHPERIGDVLKALDVKGK